MNIVWFNRRFAAKYIREGYGVPCSEKFLAKLEITGGGPRCVKDDDSVWYTSSSLDAWVSALLNQPVVFAGDRKIKEKRVTNPNVVPIKIYDIN